MNKDTNHTDQFFKDRLHDLEMPAPADMWLEIDDQLKYKRRKMWWTIAGAMAASFALIISAGVGYYFGMNNQKKNIAQTTEETPAIQKLTDIKSIYIVKENKIQKTTDNISSVLKEANINDSESNASMKKSSDNNPVPGKIENSEISVILAGGNSFDTNSSNKNSTTEPDNSSDELVMLDPMFITEIEQNENEVYLLASIVNSGPVPADSKNQLAMADNKNSDFRILIGGTIAPIYSYRAIRNNNTGYSSEYFNESEKALYTYSGGLNVQLEKGRLKIETGVYYSNMGQKIENLYVADNTIASIDKSLAGENYYMDGASTAIRNSAGNIILNSSGNVKLARENVERDVPNTPFYNTAVKATNNSKQVTAKQIFHYIELPLVAHYKIFSKQISISFSGGLSANFLLSNNILIDNSGTQESAGETTDIRNINYAGITGLSFEIPVSYRIIFRIEPRMKYYLNSIVESDKISTHPYTFGMYTGISYKF